MGISEMHIGFLCDDTAAYEPPGLPTSTEHQAAKHRYISTDATTSLPQQVAFKVEIAEMKRCPNDLRRSCLEDAHCPKVCDNDLNQTCSTSAQCSGGTCIDSGPCVDHPDVRLSWFVQEPQQRQDCPNLDCEHDNWYSRVDAAVYGQNWGTLNLPLPYPTWIDLEGLGVGIPPNYYLNVSDLGSILMAVRDRVPFENSRGGLSPRECP